MRQGAIYSAALHLAIVLIVVFGLPWLFDSDEIIEATPISVVSADQLNDLMREAKEKPKQEKEKPPEPPKPLEPPKPEPPKPEEVKIPEPPAPAPEPEVVEEVPEPEPVIAEPVPEEPMPEPIPVEEPQKVAVAKPTPPQKPKPPKKDKKKPEDKPKEEASNSMSALLNKLNTQKSSTEPQAADEQTPPTQEALQITQLSAGEEDAIRQQLKRCWNVQLVLGLPGVEDMVVPIRVELNPDGSIVRADYYNPIEVAASSATYQQFAEVARRAPYVCQRLDMPVTRSWEQWRVMIVDFSVKGML